MPNVIQLQRWKSLSWVSLHDLVNDSEDYSREPVILLQHFDPEVPSSSKCNTGDTLHKTEKSIALAEESPSWQKV